MHQIVLRVVYEGSVADVDEHLESAKTVGRNTCRDGEGGCSLRVVIATPSTEGYA